MNTANSTPSDQQEHDDMEWGYLMYETLRFWQYSVSPYTVEITAFFISDGCDEVFLSKKDCEKFLAAIKRTKCEHEQVVADVLKNWPEEIVVRATLYRV